MRVQARRGNSVTQAKTSCVSKPGMSRGASSSTKMHNRDLLRFSWIHSKVADCCAWEWIFVIASTVGSFVLDLYGKIYVVQY